MIHQAIRNANNIGYSPTTIYHADDADSYFCFRSLPRDRFDVVLFLSIVGTGELTNPMGMLSRAAHMTSRVMYLEGHNSVLYSKYMDMMLKYTDFTHIKYCGQTLDNHSTGPGRAFLRASREVFNEQYIEDLLFEKITHRTDKTLRIAVVGRGGAGKSTLRTSLMKRVQKHVEANISQTFTGPGTTYMWDKRVVLDDIGHYNSSHLVPGSVLVYFDYRAILYLEKHEIDLIIHITRAASQGGKPCLRRVYEIASGFRWT